MLTNWDLMIFADHCHARWYSPRLSKVYVGHGLFSGKKVEGRCYCYDRKYSLAHGRPIYDLMFASNDSERSHAESLTPELKGRVQVVGDPMLDELHHLKQKHGAVSRQNSVAVMSTWGVDSLIRNAGPFFAGLPRMYKDRRFVFFIHPNNWLDSRPDSYWEESYALLRKQPNVVIAAPNENPNHLLAECESVISDHTSLALYLHSYEGIGEFKKNAVYWLHTLEQRQQPKH
jgi:hypothetical protein